MTKFAENIPISPESDDTNKKLRERLIATGVFTAITLSAVVGQHTGLNHEVPLVLTDDPGVATGLEAVANSMAHPGVGYISALVGIWAADHLRHKPPAALSAVVSGTVANFGVETAQDRILSWAGIVGSDETTAHFWEQSQTGETTKDYFFALGGVASYLISEKLRNRKSKPSAEGSVQ